MIDFNEFLHQSESRDQIDIAIELYEQKNKNAELRAEIERLKEKYFLNCVLKDGGVDLVEEGES